MCVCVCVCVFVCVSVYERALGMQLDVVCNTSVYVLHYCVFFHAFCVRKAAQSHQPAFDHPTRVFLASKCVTALICLLSFNRNSTSHEHSVQGQQILQTSHTH
jgi:hypothetical protein